MCERGGLKDEGDRREDEVFAMSECVENISRVINSLLYSFFSFNQVELEMCKLNSALSIEWGGGGIE